MHAAGSLIYGAIYGAICWAFPNACSLRMFTAVVFFASLWLVAVLVKYSGLSDPPVFITLPVAIIATIVAERLVPPS